jgi:hypothetical protein
VTANIDDFEIEPEISAEEFAFSLEPLTAGDSDNPTGALNTHGQTGSEANSADTLGPANAEAVAKNVGAIRQEAERPAVKDVPSPVALMQILPADFPLPVLTRFVPNPALRIAVDEAAKYALSLEVAGPEGVKRGDAACTALRTALKKMEADFEEPKEIANRLHKQITGTIAEWGGPGKAALQTVGGRVAREQARLQQEAADARRKAQAEEDRKARERARADAEAAAKSAPAPVVEEMKRQAETATAPPVPDVQAPPKLADSTIVKTWKARPKGSSGEADPNPATEDMTPAQRTAFMELIVAIAKGEHKLIGIQPDYSYLNARARGDEKTFDIPGFEAFEQIGLRAKGGRGR